MADIPRNLYMHFPFCRGKCSYCALYSRGAVALSERKAYSAKMADALSKLSARGAKFSTVYFGGGSPALCDLNAVLSSLAPCLEIDAEVSVELHPLDVKKPLLDMLRSEGVNRISMGVESLDNATLRDMGRRYSLNEAKDAFFTVREFFDNAGIDLIVGYPRVENAEEWKIEKLADWGMTHCSVYSLQLEEESSLASREGIESSLPDDDEVMDSLKNIGEFLESISLERYEISNWARKGRECRHNSAVWAGEDYLGLGTGAYSRVALRRMRGAWGVDGEGAEEVSVVSEEDDIKERLLFRLRTRKGLDASFCPRWKETLEKFVAEGVLSSAGDIYRLTPRGMEICDYVLAALV